MADSRLEKLTRLIVQYSVSIKKGDLVRIRGSIESLPIIKETYKEVIKAGGHPHFQATVDDFESIFYENAQDFQLDFASPLDKFLVENFDASIGFFSAENPKNLTNVDPEKIKIRSQANREIFNIFLKRAAEGSLRWILAPFPTRGLAQEASMSLLEYEDFVYSSCLCDREDPISDWTAIYEGQEKTVGALNKLSEFRIVGKDTDITFSVEGRKWINGGGKENMPDGEIFTGPVETATNGKIRFSYPGIYLDREVEDITLEFKEGHVINSSAAKGEDLLNKILETDEGAKIVGEIAVGTNPNIIRFTKNMLFDEKMGGTIHLALGSAYPESGGKNQSAIHWDILKDMKDGGEIFGDGELIYKNGKFLEEFIS